MGKINGVTPAQLGKLRKDVTAIVEGIGGALNLLDSGAITPFYFKDEIQKYYTESLRLSGELNQIRKLYKTECDGYFQCINAIQLAESCLVKCEQLLVNVRK